MRIFGICDILFLRKNHGEGDAFCVTESTRPSGANKINMKERKIDSEARYFCGLGCKLFLGGINIAMAEEIDVGE